MSGVAGTLAAAAIAAAAFALATALAVWIAWPRLRAALSRVHPAARARALFWLAAAPGVAPPALLLLCFAPGWAGALGLRPDHCAAHAGHPHLCLVHPSVPLDVALLGVLAAAGVGGALCASRIIRHAIVSSRAAARLRVGAAPARWPGVLRVESERPFSFATGLLRGEIFVSSRLDEALPLELLQVVVAHEQAHARRRDGLRRLLARAFSVLHLPGLRRELLAAHALATEQACDEEAGERTGDRVRVAEAILAVERLLAVAPRGPRVPLPAFGGSSVPERVRALLADPVRRPSRAAVLCIALALAFAAGVLAAPLHHATEHWLEHVLALL